VTDVVLAGVRDDGALRLEDGWRVVESGFRPDTVVTAGSNFMTGNGYLGYRGTFAEWGPDGYVACVVTDTYDCADGRWRELATVPNPLFATWAADGVELTVHPDGSGGPLEDLERVLDVRSATFHRRATFRLPGSRATLHEERFASLARLHVVAQRHRLTATAATSLRSTSGIDTDVWSMNGQHLTDVRIHDEGVVQVVEARTVESGIDIAVARTQVVPAGARPVPVPDATTWRRRHDLEVEAGGTAVVDTYLAVFSSNDVDDPAAAAREAAVAAADDGWEALRDEHDAAWDAVWAASDVAIDGDPLAQVATRFGIMHNVIATPRHTDDLPIGARGLSCQAYQGAAFWDQELFNLPMYLHTDPEVARRLLAYRHRTLDGARRKAARLGYAGAYYAWISGKDGEELCPSFFFVDVLTGRPIRNHFDDRQIHVSPDVAWTVARYVEVTGDVDFLDERGAEIVFEVARFCASRVAVRVDTGHAHVRQVLGPDEYHEHVDDNPYTNHLVHEALDIALRVHADLRERSPQRLRELSAALSLDDAEVDRWRDVRDRLVLPGPDPATGVIEQFAGYHDLEDTTPDVVASRLQAPDEYWGWPNGVAVHTQVIKQADVVQLLVTLPERFAPAVHAANLDHYEPRTQHGSSLSFSAYAIAAARLGRTEHARELFLRSATVDLLATTSKTSGGTFIGGIRTAAAAASWMIVAQGFLGVRVRDGRLHLDPVLPAAWSRVALPLVVRGRHLHVTVTAEATVVAVTDGDDAPVTVVIGDAQLTAGPDAPAVARRSAPSRRTPRPVRG
jgi:1,2-alpha-glucosylglycerol phosphorylase